jgi:hypothetical protein
LAKKIPDSSLYELCGTIALRILIGLQAAAFAIIIPNSALAGNSFLDSCEQTED